MMMGARSRRPMTAAQVLIDKRDPLGIMSFLNQEETARMQGQAPPPMTLASPAAMALSSSTPSLPPGMFANQGAQSRRSAMMDAALLHGGRGSPSIANVGDVQQLNTGVGKVPLKFFDKGGLGSKIVQGIGEFGLQYSAQQGSPWAMSQLRMREQAAADQREDQRWQQRYDLQRADMMADREFQASQPQYFSGSEDRMRLDPTTGETSMVYDAPLDAQSYATAMGLEPGSDEYRSAMMDYTLRGSGPTAMGYRGGLEDQRQANRLSLRQTPTYANLHPRAPAARGGGGGRPPSMSSTVAPIVAKMSRGEALTAGEQRALDYYKGGGRRPAAAPRGGGGGGDGQLMQNPKTGEVIRWDAQARKWVPAK